MTRKETDGVQIVLSCEHTFSMSHQVLRQVEGTCTALCINSRNVGSGSLYGHTSFRPDLGLIPRLHARTIVWRLDYYTCTCLSCLCIELVSLILVRPLIFCLMAVLLLEPKLYSRDLAFQSKRVPKDDCTNTLANC